jgi:hypothetical protein
MNLIAAVHRSTPHSTFAFTSLLLLLAVSGFASPYAEVVVESLILNGNVGNSQTNPAAVLGAPDGLELSMGGPGAILVIDMGSDTPIVDGPGPDLEVRETGAAFGGADESYRVLISESTSVASFVEIGIGTAISLFEIAGSGLSTARYVRLEDLATETLNTQTPGSDIDSLTALHGTDLPGGPSGVAGRYTGQGALVTWEFSDGASIDGFRVRRSLDGQNYNGSPVDEPSADERGYHDTALVDVADLWYSVSVVTDAVESAAAIAHLPAYQVMLTDSNAVHLGDNVLPAWEAPNPVGVLELQVVLTAPPMGPEAKISFELFDVDESMNPILVNRTQTAELPTHFPATWLAASTRFPVGPFKPGTNTVTVYPRNSSGGSSGSLDDFMIRNITRHMYGSTNVTVLPWVVGHSPTLSPPDWTQISDHIPWNDQATNATGFFRLQRE